MRVSERHVVPWICPEWRAADGVLKRALRPIVIRRLEICDAERIIRIGRIRLQPYRALQLRDSRRIIFAKDEHTATAERCSGLQVGRTGLQRQRSGEDSVSLFELLLRLRRLIAFKIVQQHLLPTILQVDAGLNIGIGAGQERRVAAGDSVCKPRPRRPFLLRPDLCPNLELIQRNFEWNAGLAEICHRSCQIDATQGRRAL